MRNETRPVLLLVYYLLTSSLTNLSFLAFAAIVLIFLSPTFKLGTTFILIILSVLLLKSLIVGFVTIWAQRQGVFDKISGTRLIGLYFGCLWGILIGALAGYQAAAAPGAAAGALILFFLGRWTGPKVGLWMGRVSNTLVPVGDLPENGIEKPSLSRKPLTILYAAILPLLIMSAALLIQLNDIQFAVYPTRWLSAARMVVIALSVFSLLAPWVVQSRTPDPPFPLFLPGLGFSVVPVTAALFLFFMGASLIELGIYAIVSSLAALVWSTPTNPGINKSG